MAKILLLSLAATARGALVGEPALPAAWREAAAEYVGGDEMMTVLVALPRSNMAKLEAYATAVSTPGHEDYGKHLSAAEATAMTAASDADVAAALAWLGPSARLRADGSTVSAKLSVAAVEETFSTTIRRVAAGARSALRAGRYEIPIAHDAVFGLHGLPLLGDSTRVSTGAPAAVTPSVIAKTYGVPTTATSGSAKVRQAVAEFQGQEMNQTDLDAFFAEYVEGAPASDAAVYAFHGEPKVGGDGVEAMLDIEYIMALAPGLKTEFYEQMAMDFCADLKNWTSLLLATEDAPLVHSVSYGVQANLTELGCAGGAIASIDGDFAKLAARGVTVVFASGDAGSGYTGIAPQPPAPAAACGAVAHTADAVWDGESGGNIELGPPDVKSMDDAMTACCEQASAPGFNDDPAVAWDVALNGEKDDDGPDYNCNTYTKVKKATKRKKGSFAGKTVKVDPIGGANNLWPSWPAGSPWVTAVGATRFLDDRVTNGTEAAVSAEDGFGSGGGFSWINDAPAYQEAAIAHYMKEAKLPKAPAAFNKNGRGTPDVAALGTGYALIVGGQPMPGVGGTSASAPVFASLISRINDERVAAGKKPLGFLNPFLYANPGAFNDVTVGSDKVDRNGESLPYGYDCAKGWDPVTGLGTPKYAELLAAAMKN